jgi:restriction system protein
MYIFCVMTVITSKFMREIAAEIMAPSMAIHRASKSARGTDEFWYPSLPALDDPIWDDEINDFVVGCPTLPTELTEQIIGQGLLGYEYHRVDASAQMIKHYRQRLREWVKHPNWLNARLPWLPTTAPQTSGSQEMWRPSGDTAPLWVATSPTCLLLAAMLLDQGRRLSDLSWRQFEELIGALLEREGWDVELTPPTKDGGVDVIATRHDANIGLVRSIWQAKRYSEPNRVKLHEVRELSAVRSEARATKGIVVTTSRLTRDALGWIRRDTYQLGCVENPQLERWIRRLQ